MSKKLLWVMNICLHYGTTLWTLERIRNLTEFEHSVCFMNHEPNPEILAQFQALGVDIGKAPVQLTEKLVQSIDPLCILMSDTDPTRIEGDWPWTWLTDSYNMIYIHHFPVRPWIPGAFADVFVSDYLKNLYQGLINQCQRVVVAPPIDDLKPYFSVQRDYNIRRSEPVIGRVASDQPKKFPPELISLLGRVNCKSIIVGGKRYYPFADNKIFSFPAIGSKPVAKFLQEMDIFVYRTSLTETWCRTVTEAMASGLPIVAEKRGGIIEQVRDGIDGFLCENDDQMVETLRVLRDFPALREQMGCNARERAKQLVETQFEDKIKPILFECLINK